MGYIGKPQSADPITVNTSNITDGSIQAVDISSSFREAISGSFTDASASFSTRVTTAESELSNTLISSSAQIATDISGSFTAASSSFSTRTTTLEGASATTGSNSFNGNQTVTGSLTVTETIIAQEFKTEFVSASITFTSGSTKFGDTADDIHQMTGSLRITGSGDHYITDGNVGIGTTSPEVKLHIEDGNLALRNTYGIHIDDAAGTRRWVIQMDAGDDITIGDTAIDNINFDVGSKADAMVILDGGNVGIGTASPSRLLDLETTNAAGSTLMSLVSATDGNCQLLFGDTSSDTQGKVFYNNDGDYMAFTANGSERMRIDSSGNVGIGTINPTYKLDVEESGAGTFPASVVHSDGTTPRGLRITFSGGNSFGNTDDYAIFFEDNTAAHFYVAGDGSVQNVSGTYGSALSDERLKENIVDATGKLDDLLKLKVKNFTFTNDSTATKHIGFIAQEFEQVFPSLVTERDDSEHSGITDLKGLQVGMEFAILVKAIQELSAQNDSLTARIEALENA